MKNVDEQNITEINSYIQKYKWVKKQRNYNNMKDSEIQFQNKKILETLKELNNLVTKQITKEIPKINKKIQKSGGTIQPSNSSITTNINNNPELQIIDQHYKNNATILKNLNNQYKKFQSRKDSILNGKQQSLTQLKYQTQQSLIKSRAQLKQLKNQIRQSEKLLIQSHHRQTPQQREIIDHLENQLRIHSSKFVSILKKYNQSQQKLSQLASMPPLYPSRGNQIQLDQKQMAQYKQFQNIKKYTQILQHRNQSQFNKSNRIYGIKLKDLEQLIQKISICDRQIYMRQNQILQLRKEMQSLKVKNSNKQYEQNSGNIVNQQIQNQNKQEKDKLARQNLSLRQISNSSSRQRINSDTKNLQNQKIGVKKMLTERKSTITIRKSLLLGNGGNSQDSPGQLKGILPINSINNNKKLSLGIGTKY